MLNRSWAVALSCLAFGFAADPALADCKVGKIAELPVTMADMQPLAPVKVNGVEVMLLADSGAFYSLLSPSAVAEQKLPHESLPFGFTVVGVGGAADPYLTTVKTFTLADRPLNNVKFIVTPGVGGNAAGVMGQNVLGLADVEYDFAHGAIRLMQPHDCHQIAMVYWEPGKAFSTVDIEGPTAQRVTATIGAAYVNGVRIRVQFDTGAWSSVMSRAAAIRAGVKMDGPDVKPGGMTSGIGRHMVRTWTAPVASFKIGDEEIRNTRLRISDTDLPETDMLIGADFFLSHRVYVANSQHRLYFTYNGGPVFNLAARSFEQEGANGAAKETTVSVADGPDPTDAAGFSRRGAALASRREFERAIADFDRACAMAPSEPRYFYERGMARWHNNQPFMAMADLDQTLKLKPDDIQALVSRAELHMSGRDMVAAKTDLDAAALVASKEADVRFVLAGLYEHIDQLGPALDQYDLWIAAHDGDAQMARALNGRCWVRTLLGRDLDQALVDCNRAIRAVPKTASMLDSRGLVHLRLGQFDKAVADYDAALALQPKIAWSLYGRGLAKQRLGLKAEGQADLDAAAAIESDLPKKAKDYGIVEPPAK
ncbi:MAG TPA: aspartyl protease family protein [Caulobacteraceae bacterium]|jgi:tetratricopeptide (TPR) repeat protein/predicted aspartyl protease